MEELADCKEGGVYETEEGSARPPVILGEGVRAEGAGQRLRLFRVLTPFFFFFCSHVDDSSFI